MKVLYLLFASLISLNFFIPTISFSQGTPDPPNTKIVIDSDQHSMLKLAPQNYLSSDTSSIKFTNMSPGGSGTEFIIQQVGETGLNFKSFSDLSNNTTDSILFIKPNGSILLNGFKGLSSRNLGVNSNGQLIELGVSSTPWNISGSNIYYSTGSVGIGTPSPTSGYRLDVNGWMKTNLLRVNGNTDGSAWRVGITGNMIQRNGTTSLGAGNNDLVGLGATPVNDIDLTHRSSSGTADDSGVYIKNPASSGQNFKMWVSNVSGRLEFYSNDNIRAYINASNGNWTPWSDRRLKKNIKSFGSGHLDKIMKMKPVSYQMINQRSDRITFGLIAQDIRQLYPEIVEEPERDDHNFYSLSYTELIPVLIAGMQEQQAEIVELMDERINMLTDLEKLKMELLEVKAAVDAIHKNDSMVGVFSDNQKQP